MNRLLRIQTRLKAPKSQFNDFGKYHYRNCEDILEALKPLLEETKTVVTLSDEVVLTGTRYYIKATAKLKGIDGADIADTTAYAREEETKKGMDGAQITGAASSYSRKMALSGLFCIEDTKDADSTKMAPATTTAPNPPEVPPAEVRNLHAEIGKMLMEMCNDNEGDAAQMLEEMTRFVNLDGKTIKGKTSIKGLSNKHAQVVYGKTKDRYEKWLADDIELD